MSKISNAVETRTKITKIDAERYSSEIVANFMAGESYVCNPLTTLKLITASSIYGEPAYYRNGGIGTITAKSDVKKIIDGIYKVNNYVSKYNVIPEYETKTTTEIMEDAIDKALSYDFKSTLEWAAILRTEYNMRLNPQVIMTRAAIHPDRAKFTSVYPGSFNEINQIVMARADEPMSQLAYYLYKNGDKSNMPTVWKKSLAKKLSGLNRYQISKYKNSEIGMINAVRMTHANSKPINELMGTGTIEISNSEATWENLRSAGMSWKEIFNTCDMGHMALLRNLRGVFTEVDDLQFCKEYLAKLKSGVITGKQFPFRYWSAIKAIERASWCNHVPVIMEALEECMDIALENVPHITGKTMVLSDNSGSAWGGFNSEYGSVKVAEIDNLSSVMLACSSDEGYVGIFGDKLITTPVNKRKGILSQTEEISKDAERRVGGSTENGIWIFFRDAIDKKEWYDNIVIFSDQQAGHGGLYGTREGSSEYSARGFACDSEWSTHYINVMDLIAEYRKKVNPKVNIMSVQTAGYDNVVIPENIYRGTIAYGWTGQEAKLLKATTDIWDAEEFNLHTN